MRGRQNPLKKERTNPLGLRSLPDPFKGWLRFKDQPGYNSDYYQDLNSIPKLKNLIPRIPLVSEPYHAQFKILKADTQKIQIKVKGSSEIIAQFNQALTLNDFGGPKIDQKFKTGLMSSQRWLLALSTILTSRGQLELNEDFHQKDDQVVCDILLIMPDEGVLQTVNSWFYFLEQTGLELTVKDVTPKDSTDEDEE
jgi:hypothetical protein